MNRYRFSSALLLLLSIATVACRPRPAAYQYCTTPVEGWEPGDTLRYHIDTLRRSGRYQMSFGLRTSTLTAYPFQSLWVVVRQDWSNPKFSRTDTVEFKLTDDHGNTTGHGISFYQFTQNQQAYTLPAGASADIRIHHIMRREMIPGISALGVKLTPIN